MQMMRVHVKCEMKSKQNEMNRNKRNEIGTERTNRNRHSMQQKLSLKTI